MQARRVGGAALRRNALGEVLQNWLWSQTRILLRQPTAQTAVQMAVQPPVHDIFLLDRGDKNFYKTRIKYYLVFENFSI